ncbi:MAG: hypothetical protein AAGD06_23645 [Acidobacteriota bacterium]
MPSTRIPALIGRASLFAFVLAFAGFSSAGIAAAQETFFDQWRQVGPDGASVSAVAADPFDNQRLLAGLGGGLWQRQDGAPWNQIGKIPRGSFDHLVADPSRPGRFFATSVGSSVLVQTVVWLSEDWGLSWTDLEIPTGMGVAVRDVAWTTGGVWFGTSSGLWRWNGGEWTLLLDSSLLDLAVTQDASVAVALTIDFPDPARVFRSDDGGSTWISLGGLEPRTVESVALASGGSTAYAIGSDAEGAPFVASRLSGGGLWVILGDLALPTGGIRSSLHIVSWQGTDALIAVRSQGVFRSLDRGRTWTQIDFGTASVSNRDYRFATAESSLFFYGATGVWETSDLGVSFDERNAGLSSHFIEHVAIDPERSDEVYAVTNQGESFFTDNGGATWRRLPLGRTGGDVVVVPTQPRQVLIGSENGWYRSVDGGASWQLQEAAAAGRQHAVEVISVDPSNPSRIVVAGRDQEEGSPFGTLSAHWWSEDGGATWRRGESIEAAFLEDVARDPFDPSTVLLAGSSGVVRATDGGATVVPLMGDLPFVPFVWALAFDSQQPGLVLASSGNELYRSRNGGETWSLLPIEPPFSFLSELKSDSRTRGGFWASSNEGLWYSSDAGDSWSLASPSLDGRTLSTFEFDPAFPTSIYAGPYGGGLHRILLTQGLGCTHPEILCLGGSRFVVESRFRDFQGREGRGRRVDLTPNTGYFWFFDSENVEVVTKVLDGRPVNDSFWLYYGSLSNVEFQLKVTDTVNDQVASYGNPSGTFASIGDIQALPELVGVERLELPAGKLGDGRALRSEGCSDLQAALCLGDRFRLSAAWTDFDGMEGVGEPRGLTADTAYFTFFDSTNVELMVKVLDGRPINDRWWVFFASLSNVEFILTVEDLETGSVRRYLNRSGTFASVGDTEAF